MTREQAEQFINKLEWYLDNRKSLSAKKELVDLLAGNGSPVRERVTLKSVNIIIFRVAESFGISVGDITGRERTKLLARARHVAMLLLRERGMSYPEIAKAVGRVDHTTVMSGCDSICREIARDSTLRAIVDGLRSVVA